MRIVDVLLGALAQALPDRIPAASQGTMNNVAMGRHGADARWDYYETIGGGTGAPRAWAGVSGVHSHMTNTLNTPIESLETHYPLRIRRYELRRGSGGAGHFDGGDGIVREFEFLERRLGDVADRTTQRAVRGVLRAATPVQPGSNVLNGRALAPKVAFEVVAGDVLTVTTPGGGGWGTPECVAPTNAPIPAPRGPRGEIVRGPRSSVARGHPKLKRTNPGPWNCAPSDKPRPCDFEVVHRVAQVRARARQSSRDRCPRRASSKRRAGYSTHVSSASRLPRR